MLTCITYCCTISEIQKSYCELYNNVWVEVQKTIQYSFKMVWTGLYLWVVQTDTKEFPVGNKGVGACLTIDKTMYITLGLKQS